MPSKTSTDKKTAAAPVTDMASDVAALQSLGFRTMSGMGVAWAETLSDMGSEVLSFVADRIKEDVKTQHKMLHCRDMAELQKIQTEFVQTAIDQYTAETGKLVEMSQELMTVPKSDAKTGD